MKIELTITVDELLNKLAPVNWFRNNEDAANEKRYQYALTEFQKHYPGKYELEEYYDSDKMCFKYRLKFLTEQDEMWFRLKYQ